MRTLSTWKKHLDGQIRHIDFGSIVELPVAKGNYAAGTIIEIITCGPDNGNNHLGMTSEGIGITRYTLDANGDLIGGATISPLIIGSSPFDITGYSSGRSTLYHAHLCRLSAFDSGRLVLLFSIYRHFEETHYDPDLDQDVTTSTDVVALYHSYSDDGGDTWATPQCLNNCPYGAKSDYAFESESIQHTIGAVSYTGHHVKIPAHVNPNTGHQWPQTYGFLIEQCGLISDTSCAVGLYYTEDGSSFISTIAGDVPYTILIEDSEKIPSSSPYYSALVDKYWNACETDMAYIGDGKILLIARHARGADSSVPENCGCLQMVVTDYGHTRGTVEVSNVPGMPSTSGILGVTPSILYAGGKIWAFVGDRGGMLRTPVHYFELERFWLYCADPATIIADSQAWAIADLIDPYTSAALVSLPRPAFVSEIAFPDAQTGSFLAATKSLLLSNGKMLIVTNEESYDAINSTQYRIVIGELLAPTGMVSGFGQGHKVSGFGQGHKVSF